MSTPLFDHTALSDLECEQEFVYRHRDGLVSARDEGPALLCGRAIHAGVRAYYDNQSEGLVADAVTRAWGDREAVLGTDFRTLALAQDYVGWYMRVYPRPWGFTVLHNEGYLESDTASGIPDRIVRRDVDGGVYPLDLKTTSLWLGATWQEQWRHSQQAAIQMDLADGLLRDGVRNLDESPYPTLTCAGFWMDAIYLSSRKAGPKAEDFVRCGPFAYSEALRAELREGVVRRSVRAAELRDGSGAPPLKNPNACMRFNRLCTFFRYCALDPQDRVDAVALAQATGELVERRWNPAQRDSAP